MLTAASHGRERPVLVLTRHANQSIVIGNDIVVTVLQVRGDQVRLGIDAPRDIQVHRQEVFLALEEANRQAALSAEQLDTLDTFAPPVREPEG
jgi:carbon storage regulator